MKGAISIHAPVKGATHLCTVLACNKQYFNPRSREGSDRSSITSLSLPPDFNPRSREGSD